MTDKHAALSINTQRLWSDLMTSGSIGAGKSTGLRRLTLGDDDKRMRDAFVDWCKQTGCSVTIDKVGNIFARRDGTDNSLAPVLMGSHLDTQIAGGKFDGILGVLAGLEVIRTLNDNDIQTKRAIEVVNWTNEEGTRFQPPMMGSGAFAGVHDLDWVMAQQDEDKISFGDALKQIGYDGNDKCDIGHIDAYFELHIEQGPILDKEKIHVGIVTGGFTSFGCQLAFKGENAHSGPTPMDKRKDALVGAAIIVAGVNRIGWDYHPEGRATCARLEVTPNKYGIIADHAELNIDVRHPDPKRAHEMYQKALALMDVAAKQANVEVSIVKEWSFGDVKFDEDLIESVRSVVTDLNISNKDLLSAAGHDAYHISKIIPTAMIFTPCMDGITHNEKEHIEPEYTTPGVNVLLHSVLRRANR